MHRNPNDDLYDHPVKKNMEDLSGGREASIFRKGDVVYRPLQPWSPTVHCVLKHLTEAGVEESPIFIGIEGKQEKLKFVPGDTYNYSLSGAIATSEALTSAAVLLRKLHDASVPLLSEIDIANQPWMLTPRKPYEVICHGDFAPYNVALSGDTVAGVFDFDTVHPAPRVWDLAYSIYCWAPFKTECIGELGALDNQVHRAKLFCDSYGATRDQRQQLANTMIDRLRALIEFMRNEAHRGNAKCLNDIEHGHLQTYLSDIEYIEKNRQEIQRALD